MAAQPFAFERQFSDVQSPSNDAVDTFAESIAAAEARGFAAGEEAALVRLRSEQASRIEELLEMLVTQVGRGEKLAEQRSAILEREAEALAIAAAELLAGRLADAAPAGAIGAALTDILGELRRGLPLALWVHPDLKDPVDAFIAEHQRGERRARTITVAVDPKLAPGDARLAWEKGQTLVDAGARRAALHSLLDQRETSQPT